MLVHLTKQIRIPTINQWKILHWSVAILLVVNILTPLSTLLLKFGTSTQLDENIPNIELIQSTITSMPETMEASIDSPEPVSNEVNDLDSNLHPSEVLPEPEDSSPVKIASELLPITYQCYDIGPINQTEQDYLTELLEGLNMQVNHSTRKRDEKIGYWVHLDPQRSKALGRLKVEEIKLLGIKDVSLIINDLPRYAVSLGMYLDESRALQRMIKAQSLGLKAKLNTRFKTVRENWLNIKTRTIYDLDEMAWSDLLINYPNIELRSVECVNSQ